MTTETTTTKPAKPEKIHIFIDGAKYTADSHQLTGTQIRALAKPPVGHDRDLWLDIVDKLDELIGDETVIEIEAKMRFFTVPRVINPGSAHRAQPGGLSSQTANPTSATGRTDHP